VPVEKVLGELMQRDNGLMRGKGGSMHLTSEEHGVMGSYAIIGAHLPIACGAAWRAQYKGDKAVSVCFFGDGTTNIGAFHEAMNMAQLWKLPVIFLCQNNRYGEHTAFADHTKVDSIVTRAKAYGMEGVKVDGNDAIAMYNTTKAAVDRARAGDGPTLIEAMCYRMLGHFFGADFSYMPPEHLAEMATEDPLPRLRQLMLDHQFTEAELDAIVADLDAQMDAAAEFAANSPLPEPEEIRKDVFEEEIAA